MKMIEKTQTDVVKERAQRTESLPKEMEEAHGFHLVWGLVCMMTDDEKLLLGSFPSIRNMKGPDRSVLDSRKPDRVNRIS